MDGNTAEEALPSGNSSPSNIFSSSSSPRQTDDSDPTLCNLHVLSAVAASSSELQSNSRFGWNEPRPQPTSSSVFGSPLLVDVLAGSPATPTVQSFAVTPLDLSHGESPFRSPPFRSESSSLMELQTVTPSRIDSSPRKILKSTQGGQQSCAGTEDMSNSITGSQSYLPREHTAPLTEVVVHDVSKYEDRSFQSIATDHGQFKIVIGGDSPEKLDSDSLATVSKYGDKSMKSHQLDNRKKSSSSKSKAGNTINEGDSDDEVESQNIKDIQKSLNIQQDNIAESIKVAKKGKVTKLPRELRGLMGEANLRYARGEHEDTIKMCLEVIRIAPYAAEPFETLAMIYEERGETVKALQYSLLAAHVTPTDAEQWHHLGQLCLRQNDRFKALNCFCKAFSADRSNFEIAIRCAKMYLEINSFSNALHKYKGAMLAMKDSHAAVELAREAAKLFHAKEENQCAIEILDEALKQHPLLFKDQDANMLCELLLLSGKCGAALQMLVKHSGISLKLKGRDFNEGIESCESITDYESLEAVKVPPAVPVDLKGKMVVAMIRLSKSELVQDIVQDICAHDPADIGDLQFDLAETYMDVNEPHKALKILDGLVASPHYGLAAVWLRHADCCEQCGDTEKALFSYRQCINLAPGHVHSYLVYSGVLRRVGRFDIAVQALDEASAYECDGKIRMRLHIERYKVFREWGEKSQPEKLGSAADEALLMFANRLKICFIDAKILLLRRKRPPNDPLMGEVKLIRRRDREKYHDAVFNCDQASSDGDHSMLSREEWLQLLDDTIVLLIGCGRFRDAVNLGEAAQHLSIWSDHQPTKQLLENITFSACLLAGNYHNAYKYVRLWLMQDPDSSQMWNLFNQITARTEDQRHHRYCSRLSLKHPNHDVLRILSGHNFLAAGSYRSAMADYTHVHRKMPNDPLLLMLIGVIFIHIASQKFSEQKNSLIVQGLAFFNNYAKERDIEQESLYNMGRALHQLGLEHFAIHYYNKALEAPVLKVRPPTIDGAVTEVAGSNPADLDLRCEIAHNLSVIYRRSGNHDMANRIQQRYLVI